MELIYAVIFCVSILSVVGSEPPMSANAQEAKRSGGWDGCSQMVCTADYEPVCGSDGKTYSNYCMLTIAQCQDPTIRMVFRRACSSPEAARDAQVVDCDHIHCTRDYRPVCGSDNKSYFSRCLLQKARCQNNPTLTVEYEGLCKRESMPVHPHTEIPPHIPEDCRTMCTMEYEPVCGSDGRTYSNKCELESIACVQRNGLKMAKKGACGSPDTPLRMKRSKNCDNKCPKMYKPVCGSDGKTYNNECLLLVAKCELESDTLSVAYKGKC